MRSVSILARRDFGTRRHSAGSTVSVLINFILRPIIDVSPWGDDEPRLLWFGLTEGWFWLETDQQEVFLFDVNRFCRCISSRLAALVGHQNSEIRVPADLR